MNKYTIITVAAIVVIIIPVLYGIWGIYSVEQLELRKTESEFSYFEMASYEKIQMCNPLPFFVSFSGMTIEAYYTNDLKGIFEIGASTIDPNTSQVLELNFSSENFAEAQYLFMHMDGQFDGEIPIRIDPRKMILVTVYETKIIGVIPFQNTITQSGFEFTNMMNEESSCENKN